MALAIFSDTVSMHLADDLPVDRTLAASLPTDPRSPRGHSALYGVAGLVLVVQAVWTLEWIVIAAGNLNGPEGIGLAIAYSWIFWLIGEMVLFPASLFAWAIIFVDGRRSR